MKCPKCGAEMEPGYLQSDHRTSISFVRSLMPFGLGFLKSSALIVSQELKIGINAVPAHICRRCKLFAGDYSGKE